MATTSSKASASDTRRAQLARRVHEGCQRHTSELAMKWLKLTWKVLTSRVPSVGHHTLCPNCGEEIRCEELGGVETQLRTVLVITLIFVLGFAAGVYWTHHLRPTIFCP